MKIINEDIKNQLFKPMYLLYGEETYLKKVCKKKLKNALVAPDDTMNYTYLEGKNCNPKEIIDLAETMPFFAERRLILLENTGFFKQKCEDLADYLKEPSAQTIFVFIESEVDKRGRMYKAVKNKGRVVELNQQDEKTLIRWTLGILKKENKNITQDTMHYLLEKTGADMENIQTELEKLICYTLDRDVITSNDVEAICSAKISNNIFDMIHAVADKKQKKALDYYYDLLALKEPPMRILFLLARQFQLLFQVKDLVRLGFSSSEIAKKIGVPRFAVGKYTAQARAFSMKQIKHMMESCVTTEEAVKTGRMNDMMSVELLLVQFSS